MITIQKNIYNHYLEDFWSFNHCQHIIILNYWSPIMYFDQNWVGISSLFFWSKRNAKWRDVIPTNLTFFLLFIVSTITTNLTFSYCLLFLDLFFQKCIIWILSLFFAFWFFACCFYTSFTQNNIDEKRRRSQ